MNGMNGEKQGGQKARRGIYLEGAAEKEDRQSGQGVKKKIGQMIAER